MPEPTDDELGIPEGLDPNIRAELRKSRMRGKEAEEAKAEAEASKRELEFYKAGIPADGVGELFRTAYTGPMDVEAIKAKAASYGIDLGAPVAGAPTQADADALIALELDRQRQMQQGSEGARAPGTPELRSQFIKDMKATTSDAEALALIKSRGREIGVRIPVQGGE